MFPSLLPHAKCAPLALTQIQRAPVVDSNASDNVPPKFSKKNYFFIK